MLDILISSLMIALVVLMVYWVILFGDHIAREAKHISGAVEPQPIVHVPEESQLFTVGDDWCMWCERIGKPLSIIRPIVNEQRVAVTVEEQHVYYKVWIS